ncbi:MAG: molecular chaperone DnaJ [Candidatus Izimaplasma sp.]|nr:molecular chaperone DnaJ [Candidatus Izimaplasma bacterium]
MSKRDYYEVLGINKGANDAEIKKAYRTLAKKYHPDVSSESNAEAKFKEVQEAYEVLSDSSKRSQYDRFGHQANHGQGFQSSGFDFDINDIFSSFFGGGGGSPRTTNRPRKGQDIQKRMTVSFNESIFGAKKHIRVNVHEECHTCHGTGAFSKKDVKTCTRCHGKGTVIVQQQSLFGTTRTQTTCPVCHGKGKIVTKKCTTCNGEGIVTHNKEIEVKVPVGIDTGQQIRLEGYGNKGYNGGPSGDLYILFDVKKHPLYERHNDDLVIEIPITFAQAAIGDNIKVPTPYGDVKLKVPAGTQSKTTFRLKGKGAPNVRSKRPGDEHVIINVVTPNKLTKQQTKLFNELAKTDLTKDSSIWEKFKKALKG